MSLVRACVIGVIIGFTLYAMFVLVYKQVSKESVQHLRKDVCETVDAKLDMLHLRQKSTIESTSVVPVVQASAITVEQQPSLPINSESKAHVSLSDIIHSALAPLSPAVDRADPVRSPEQTTCRSYLEKYAVIPGVSWGTLPTELQKSWKDLHCDEHLRADVDTVTQAVEQATPATPVIPIPVSAENDKKKWKKGKKKPGKVAGIADLDKDNTVWCHESKDKYKVIPMRSWGSLPMNYVETWRSRRCDLIFTTERMSTRPLSLCPDTSAAAAGAGKDKKKEAVHSNMRDDLPLIAVMAATTTRKIDKPNTRNLSLFMYLLPSLVRTLDCGFRYEYVMGYDKGDPFYDSKEGMAEVKQWWKEHVEDPMRKNGIKVTLRLVKVNNTVKKPGPVFLEMARAAYNAGAAYFYRINDDTELMVNWARKYVDGLNTLSAPYGVIGPLCNQGNEKILTHDFTSRLHMEIFEMNYYPPELTDWWMDDWISLVYGRQRTFKARSVPVMHHTGTHGTRYAVDSANGARLKTLVESGRKKIRQYMLTHNVPENVLRAFDLDEYKAFTHMDIPSSSK